MVVSNLVIFTVRHRAVLQIPMKATVKKVNKATGKGKASTTLTSARTQKAGRQKDVSAAQQALCKRQSTKKGERESFRDEDHDSGDSDLSLSPSPEPAITHVPIRAKAKQKQPPAAAAPSAKTKNPVRTAEHENSRKSSSGPEPTLPIRAKGKQMVPSSVTAKKAIPSAKAGQKVDVYPEAKHPEGRKRGRAVAVQPQVGQKRVSLDIQSSLEEEEEEATPPPRKRRPPARHSSGYFSLSSPLQLSHPEPSSPTSTLTLHSSQVEADINVTAGFEDICRVRQLRGCG